MTSTLSTIFLSPMSNIAAQDLIKLQNSVFKHGVLRKKGRKLNIGKWPHRFVVLTHDSIYVFANEASKTPNSKFSLLGYNSVSRCEMKGQEWCFSIVPASSMDSVKVKTFACFSDAERKAWMMAIKQQIYAANNISKPAMTVLDKIKSMAIGETDESDYIDIEHKVYETNDGNVIEKDSDDDDKDSDSSFESDTEFNAINFKKTTRSLSLPQNSLHRPIFDSKSSLKYNRNRKFSEDVSKESSDYETCEDVELTLSSSQKGKRRLPSDPQPRIPLDSDETPRPSSDPVQIPPRYSECYTEEEEQCGDSDYVNLARLKEEGYFSPEPSQPPSLESMCTLLNTSYDRDQLNSMLQAKGPGTYLIRKSRTEDQNVLVVYNQDGQFKEYRIHGSPENCTLDRKQYFTSTEELLQYYTSVQNLPNTNYFLQRGIHQIDEETEPQIVWFANFQTQFVRNRVL